MPPQDLRYRLLEIRTPHESIGQKHGAGVAFVSTGELRGLERAFLPLLEDERRRVCELDLGARCLLEHGRECTEGGFAIGGEDQSGTGRPQVLCESMLQGCRIFRDFLTQIEEASGRLASSEKETGDLLGLANHLQNSLATLRHITFHFRLEDSRPRQRISEDIQTDYKEMQKALSFPETGRRFAGTDPDNDSRQALGSPSMF